MTLQGGMEFDSSSPSSINHNRGCCAIIIAFDHFSTLLPSSPHAPLGTPWPPLPVGHMFMNERTIFLNSCDSVLKLIK